VSQSVVSVRRSISFQSNLNRLTFLTAIFARVRVTTKAGRGKKVKVINGSMSRVLVRDNKDGNAVGLYGAIVDREQFVFCCSAYTEDCQHMRAICSLSEFTAAISVSQMPEEPRVVHGSISCDPTQPNPLQVEKFGPNQPNPIQLTMELTVGSDVFLYTELIGFPYLSDRP